MGAGLVVGCEARRGGDGLEGVGGAGNDVERAVDARVAEGGGVGAAFAIEQLDVAHSDPRRGETGEIGSPGRGSVRRKIGSSGFLTEVGLPAGPVRFVVPESVPDGVEFAAAGCAVVEHRAEEPLCDRLDAALIMDSLNQCRGQAASGALPADRDPGRVHADVDDGFEQGVPGEEAVVESCGERALRCEPVFDRHHHDAEVASDVGHVDVVLGRLPDHHATAVDVQQGRPLSAIGG